MAKSKYTIIDSDGNDMGFVVVETSPKFENTSPINFIPYDGPLGDGALFAIVLGVITFALWLGGVPQAAASIIGVFLTSILAGIKAWRGALFTTDPKTDEVTIKVESWQDNHVELDEVQDKTISLDDWRTVAKAIIYDGCNFSRPALSGYVSQTTYHKIKDEFTRLNFAHRKGNNYILSPRALAFLRKVHSLPY